jgi:(R,R)-butanediol dehydrogenase/meso-butanediol dehydrogenase/diacetyl reductase
MRAIRWYGAQDLRFEPADDPSPGPGQALVRVAYCGICGTDLAEYQKGPVLIRTGPHPLTGARPPITLGHEFSGRVVAVGEGVADTMIGRRVCVDPCWRCGECFWCLRGDYHICRSGGSVGLASDGALADLVVVPADGLVPLPDGVTDEVGALVEPLAVGVHAVSRGRAQEGEWALVIGCGPIGLAVLMAARAHGLQVLVVEPSPVRRALALSLGAERAFDPAVDDARREAYLITSKTGADLVFECTGLPDMLGFAVSSARRGGRVVLVGIGQGVSELSTQQVVPYEREIIGALGYRNDLPTVVQLIADGRMDPAPLITNIIPMEDAVREGFERLARSKDEGMKTLIAVGAEPR